MTWLATVHRHIKTADVYHYANAKITEISVDFFQPPYSGYRLELFQSGVVPVISVNQNLLTVSFLPNCPAHHCRTSHQLC